MTADLHTLEPFPVFVENSMYYSSSPSHFSKLALIQRMISSPSASKLEKFATVQPSKLTKYLQLRYHQYEVTFGLYVMTPMEKLVLNTIVLGIFAALSYALYIGLQPFVVRSLCHLIYYLYGGLTGVENLCTDAVCS